MRALNLPLLIAWWGLASCGSRLEPSKSGPPSCERQTSGAGPDCGANRATNCCASTLIEGGRFNRFNDPAYPATISSFRMDLFEVTVGRFRTFVEAMPGSRPSPGAGAHPKVPGSGWKTEWDEYLGSRASIEAGLVAGASDPPSLYVTWTQTAGPNEYMPASCMTWYEAFAFCAWDGGRLPTDSEWNYVAAGGAEQRKYPWGSDAPDATRAVLAFTPTAHLTPVGSAPRGAARWGVMDMAGSRREWVRDGSASSDATIGVPTSCVDCLRMDNGPFAYFLLRDFHWVASPAFADVAARASMTADTRYRGAANGVRCVRDVE